MTSPSRISAHCLNLMKREDSYSERRQLFKNIWDTAMQIDEKDADIMNKPKVIKTLRLDEVDRCVIGKKKKERLRNLRTVCNKILDFCDRQDADDKFFEQVAEGQVQIQQKLGSKIKKFKRHGARRKVKKAKSAFGPKITIVNQAKATTSDRKNDYFNDRTQSPSSNKIKKKVVRRTLTRYRSTKLKSSSDNAAANKSPGKASVTRRKIVCRKRRSKRKKLSIPEVSPPRPSGVSNNVRYVTTPLKGRTVAKRIKELLGGE